MPDPADEQLPPEQGAPSAAEPAAEQGAAIGTMSLLLEQVEALKKDNDGLRAELSDLKDKYLRASAEFENTRKRLVREKEENAKYANTGLLGDLVNVLDDFERAIKSSEASRDYDSFHTGIVLIEQQFVSMLERKYNLRRVTALGAAFNPDHHEAISMDPPEEGKETVVVEEYQKGYALHDRVLRTAKVKVGHPKDEPAPETKE